MGNSPDHGQRGLSRRGFLQAGATVGAGLAIASGSSTARAAEVGGAAASRPGQVLTPDALRVAGLRVGAMPDPMGIQTNQPCLSWLLTGTGSGRRQTAYQVQLATDTSRLARGEPDLWDSGRVMSDATAWVGYDGRALTSRERAWWRVRVWDEHGRASGWSAVGRFELGLLEPEDWSASWIGNPAWDALTSPVPPAVITLSPQRARWVRLVVTRLGLPLPEGGFPTPVSRLQLAEFEVLDSARPTVDLALGCAVDATDVYAVSGSWEPAYLTDGKTSGDTAPYGFTSTQFDTQDIASTPITITIDLGSVQEFDTIRLYPRTGTLTAAGQTPNFPEDFTIQVSDDADTSFSVVDSVTGQPAPEPAPVPAGLPLFATRFTITKQVASARLYIAGLGVYDATINGKPTTDAALEPGNTTYTRHIDYATLDVTDLLRRGDNTIGVSVGTGIYDTLTYDTRYAKFNARVGAPKLVAQLEIGYADGSSDTVTTDASWRTTQGPTTFSNWYGGEDYDARLLPAGWNLAGADLSSWQQVSRSAAPAATTVLTARSGPPVAGVATAVPQRVTQPTPGVYVFDFGTNCAGWQRLRVHGSAGTTVRMRPAELLKADGTIDYGTTGNPIYDDYTLSGEGIETWQPRFIYHGFRYIQLEGLPYAPEPDTMTATVLRAVNASSGAFTCSNELVNGIHRIIDRAVQSNMFSVLTDCPTREKLGWMEQDHLAFDTVARNYDIAAYGHDIVRAMADAQLDTGLVPDIAPEYTVFSGGFRDDPNWGSAMVLVPWQLYQTYGDTELLETYYPNMRRYVDYLSTKATGNLLDYGLGDWATINTTTPTGVTATYGYYRAVDALCAVAGVLGMAADASRYARLRDQIGAAYHAEYYDATHQTYANGSQSSDALSLDMGVVPAELREGVLAHLIANLRTNGYHLDLGEIGLPALFDVLWSAGRSDVIYLIATQTTAPSYGAMLARGATSLTEFWDGTGSQNHFMLGAIDKWFTLGLAGIGQVDGAVGYTDLLIQPAFVGDLTHVLGRYQTTLGMVTSEWHRSGEQATLALDLPVGTTATVRLPGQPDQHVASGGYRFTVTTDA